jgi:hypothetical protein
LATNGTTIPTDLPEQRLAKYRRMAAQTRESAYNSRTTENRDAYMDLATAWETMAVDLEHTEEAKQLIFGVGGKPLGPSIPRH